MHGTLGWFHYRQLAARLFPSRDLYRNGPLETSVHCKNADCTCHTSKTAAEIKVIPSPRLDWCSACQKEHGYDCPKDAKPQAPQGEDWQERLGEFARKRDDVYARIDFTKQTAELNWKLIGDFVELERLQAKKQGAEEAAEKCRLEIIAWIERDRSKQLEPRLILDNVYLSLKYLPDIGEERLKDK